MARKKAYVYVLTSSLKIVYFIFNRSQQVKVWAYEGA